jgi:hypothetical protein
MASGSGKTMTATLPPDGCSLTLDDGFDVLTFAN